MNTDIMAISEQYAVMMKDLTASLLAGTITLADWHAQMQDAIRASTLQQAIADSGKALTPAQTATVEAHIKEQYGHLDTFASNIQKAATQPGADLTEIAARSQVYAAPEGATIEDTGIAPKPGADTGDTANVPTLADLLATGITLAAAIKERRDAQAAQDAKDAADAKLQAEQDASAAKEQAARDAEAERIAKLPDYKSPPGAPPELPIGRLQINADQDTTDAITEHYMSQMFTLMGNLKSGKLTVTEWHGDIQDLIRSLYLQQANAGKDGPVSESDYGKIEAAIEAQYKYLDGFARDVQAAVEGDGDLGFMAARASMYVQSGESQYWDQALSDIDLPAIPRDGSTVCLSRCQCSWDLQHGEDGTVNATWLLGEADHCEDCVRRSQEWAPLVIPLKDRNN